MRRRPDANPLPAEEGIDATRRHREKDDDHEDDLPGGVAPLPLLLRWRIRSGLPNTGDLRHLKTPALRVDYFTWVRSG